MPTAREALLNAAFLAVHRRPWGVVRMVDVAAAAGVSRQTLYNEFGNKDGLARALVRREAEAYLQGVERALAPATDASGPADRLAAVAAWTVRTARGNALVRAALTGCWNDRLPAPAPGPRACPGQRHPNGGPALVHVGREPLARPGGPAGGVDVLPTPADLVRQVTDRSRAALSSHWPTDATAELVRVCEAAARLAVSYVSVPGGPDEVAVLVRQVLGPWRVVNQGDQAHQVEREPQGEDADRPGRTGGADLPGRPERVVPGWP
ncbi:TetR/AcrR family transcriptional regulator [Streptomyces sp. NPDC057702]|uniref:TetR/AcrR family transcriptional regulator n=1 Tax=unclassified Streptomyces TaxID=2593676 RepID=UPI0036AF17C1